jgi:hypothetical protein
MGAREESFETDDAVPFAYRRLKTAPWLEVVVDFLGRRVVEGRTLPVDDLFTGSAFSLIRIFFDTTGATSFRDFEEAVLVL